MLRKNWQKFFGLTLIVFGLLIVAKLAGAQIDAGTNAINDTIALSGEDPRTIVARVINIALLFLGVIAVGIVLFAGFKWMTSGGEEQKISEAQKLLRNGVIGLVIILAAWGIAVFVLNRLIGATGNGGENNCTSGLPCPCGGTWECDASGNRSCVGGNCGFQAPERCTTVVGDATCQTGTCSDGYTCDDACICRKQGALGDSCNAAASATCVPDESKCGPNLTCGDTCTCEGAPTITEVSPTGGFCSQDPNQPCASNADCGGTNTCNELNPNGAEKNLLSIYGYNFGSLLPGDRVVFVQGTTEVAALVPEGFCSTNYWQDGQIIIAIPAGLSGDYSLKVIRSDNQSDTTQDKNGPIIPDFKANTIIRPGLCSLSPSRADVGELSYNGLNILDASPYFGSYSSSIPGGRVINLATQGSTAIPDLKTGKTNFFVEKVINNFSQKSNYLKFEKFNVQENVAFISGFEPATGKSGQYVTITGRGFGRVKGQSEVYFVPVAGDKIKANYDFPKVCANSIWSDEQIIVKVPTGLVDGNYILKISLTAQNKELSSASLVPNNSFLFNAAAPLAPGLCKMAPIRGQINSPVILYGEYFGVSNQPGVAVFYSEQATSSLIKAAGDNKSQYIKTATPNSSASGPVVVRNTLDSNPLNFSVGACQNNDECGEQVCCPNGTSKKGRCVDALSDCYSASKNSVFEWKFNTNYANLVDNYSCNGWAQATGACHSGATCPNSPGQCSPFNLVNPVASGDCCAAGFTYDSESQQCFKNGSERICSLPFATITGAKVVCKEFSSGFKHWQVTSAGLPVLPADIKPSSLKNISWINLGANKYTDSQAAADTCALCADGLNCFDNSDPAQAGQGICAQGLACAGGSACNATDNKCYATPSCQCCCEKGKDARDCCAGLTCTGTCGGNTDPNSGSGTLGRCGGCASVGSSQAEHDGACNCSGHSGQYCEVNDPNFPSGYCTDCDGLTAANCNDHSSVCCVDGKKDNACRSGSGQLVSNDPFDLDHYGYCAYYDCQAEPNQAQCNIANPFVNGLYASPEICTGACQTNPGASHCAALSEEAACRDAAEATCCWDKKNGVCLGAEKINNGNSEEYGYCAFYDCSDCTAATPLGAYLGASSCQKNCSPGPGLGLNCSGSANNGTCDPFTCAAPFGCLNQNGGSGDSEDCGTCCCQVSDTNSCATLNTLHPETKLTCQADQAPCSGPDRGLCCGCLEDDFCGNAATTGCDASACCRARPEVLSDQTVPAERAENVCRNALIKVTFNQAMNVSSFTGNILLLERHTPGSSCPAGTFLADKSLLDRDNNLNLLARLKEKFLALSQSILMIFSRQDTARAAFSEPADNDVYCSVPGLTANEKNSNGTLTFSPSKLLSADTTYYIIIKGDEFLQSNGGVLSFWNVGLNGDGLRFQAGVNALEGADIKFNNLNYKNSYISVFKTLPDNATNAGVCMIDHVKISPASYLFQTTESDLSENDNDPLNASFDTKKDNDKVFSAYAQSADNQYLAPIPGVYNWDFAWSVDDNNVAQTLSTAGLESNRKNILAKYGVKDANTLAWARVDMGAYGSNLFFTGQDLKAASPLYIFDCANPWPKANPDGTWNPWKDNSGNCGAGGGNCLSYNYKFYYCRDAGQPGTADDLPAISSTAINVGQNASLICSDGGGACLPPLNDQSRCGQDKNGDGAPDGFCIYSILKESYFFRSATPEIVTISSLSDQRTGGAVKLEWNSALNLIDNNQPTQVDAYKIYYGITGGAQTTKRIQPSDQVGESPICSSSGGVNPKYNCSLVLNGLANDQPYSFRVTALTSNNAESELSDEVLVTPTSQTPPQAPPPN